MALLAGQRAPLQAILNIGRLAYFRVGGSRRIGKHVLRDATVYLGTVDLSDYVESVEVLVGKGSARATAMQDAWDDGLSADLKRWSVRLRLYQDYDSNKTYAELKDALTSGDALTVFVKPTTMTCCATNPGLSGSTVFSGDMPQLIGSVGDVHRFTVNLKGVGALTFVTTSTA